MDRRIGRNETGRRRSLSVGGRLTAGVTQSLGGAKKGSIATPLHLSSLLLLVRCACVVAWQAYEWVEHPIL